MSVWDVEGCRHTQVTSTPTPIENNATEPYYIMSVWHMAEWRCTHVRCTLPHSLHPLQHSSTTRCHLYVAECRCTHVRPFCHRKHVNWLKCFHVTTLNNCSSHSVLSWGFIRNYLMHHFHLCEQRAHIPIFWSQHQMHVMDCDVVWNVHGGLSLCQLTQPLSIYVLVNMWCTSFTVMDITVCIGHSTNHTTLCYRHVSNSWQSTLQNIHVHNTLSI